EALAGLNHSDRARRESALERLTRLAGQNARDVDIGAIAVCTIATLRSDGEKLAGRLMDLLRVCAPQLARSSARVGEILRVLLTLVSTAAHNATSRELEQLAGPAYRLLYSLGNAAP